MAHSVDWTARIRSTKFCDSGVVRPVSCSTAEQTLKFAGFAEGHGSAYLRPDTGGSAKLSYVNSRGSGLSASSIYIVHVGIELPCFLRIQRGYCINYPQDNIIAHK